MEEAHLDDFKREKERRYMFCYSILYPGFIHETQIPHHPESGAAAVKISFWVTFTEVELFVQIQKQQRPWQSSALGMSRHKMTSVETGKPEEDFLFEIGKLWG